eukprot:Pgem_evm1s147
MTIINLVFVVVCFSLKLITYTNAHGTLQYPTVRVSRAGKENDWEQQSILYNLNGGYQNHFKSGDFRCRGFTKMVPESKRAVLKAGQKLNLKFFFHVQHPGDCFLYLSKCDADQSTPDEWYKIMNLPGCGMENDANNKRDFSWGFDIQLP